MEKEILDNLAKEAIDSNARFEILKDLKRKAESILEFINKMEKIQKPTKESKKAKKVIEGFIRCNITSPAIYKRYQEVMILLERFKNVEA